MNKTIKAAILAATTILTLASCQKENKQNCPIIGTWETRNVTLDTHIKVTFNDNNTFVMHQTIGEGRPEKFKGTWTLSNGVIMGTYDASTPHKKLPAPTSQATSKATPVAPASSISTSTSTTSLEEDLTPCLTNTRFLGQTKTPSLEVTETGVLTKTPFWFNGQNDFAKALSTIQNVTTGEATDWMTSVKTGERTGLATGLTTGEATKADRIETGNTNNIKPSPEPWASAYQIDFNSDNSEMTWTSVLDSSDINVYTRIK